MLYVVIEQVVGTTVPLAVRGVRVSSNEAFASNLVTNVEGVRAVKSQNITGIVVNIVGCKSA